MAETATKYSKGTRVVVTEDIDGAPEGTPGNVRIAVGLTWLRYRVQFDNGADVGTVGHEKLVPEDQWEHYKENRVRLAAEAEEAATAAAEAAKNAPPKQEAPAGGGDDRLAALMARSKAARESKS